MTEPVAEKTTFNWVDTHGTEGGGLESSPFYQTISTTINSSSAWMYLCYRMVRQVIQMLSSPNLTSNSHNFQMVGTPNDFLGKLGIHLYQPMNYQARRG
jgi:hypothetical protein